MKFNINNSNEIFQSKTIHNSWYSFYHIIIILLVPTLVNPSAMQYQLRLTGKMNKVDFKNYLTYT